MSSTPSATSRRPRSWASATVCRTIALARGSRVDVGRQAPVELELVGGQVPEVGQGAVAGAVVVDRRPDAEPAQVAQHLAAALGVGHQGVLDQFQGQRRRRQVRAARSASETLQGEVEVVDVGRRQVDRDRHLLLRPPAGRRPSSDSSITVSVSGRRSPACSAAGSSSAGDSRPRVGWFQRTRASHAHDPAVGQGDLRLQVDDELVGGQRGAELLHRAQPVAAAAVRSRAGRRARPPWPDFAAYMATSAQRSSSCTVVAGTGAVETPMLTPTCRRMPSTVNGSRMCSRSRRAMSWASSRPAPGSRTANSSPPSRASTGRAARARRAAAGPTWRSSWSPAWWPRLSLTSLNPSRSSSRSAAGVRAVAVGQHGLRPLEQRAAVGQPGELVGARLLADLVEGRGPRGRSPRCGRGRRARSRSRARPRRRAAGRPSPKASTPRLAMVQTSGSASRRSAVRARVSSAGSGDRAGPGAGRGDGDQADADQPAEVERAAVDVGAGRGPDEQDWMSPAQDEAAGRRSRSAACGRAGRRGSSRRRRATRSSRRSLVGQARSISGSGVLTVVGLQVGPEQEGHARRRSSPGRRSGRRATCSGGSGRPGRGSARPWSRRAARRPPGEQRVDHRRDRAAVAGHAGDAREQRARGVAARR